MCLGRLGTVTKVWNEDGVSLDFAIAPKVASSLLRCAQSCVRLVLRSYLGGRAEPAANRNGPHKLSNERVGSFEKPMISLN